MIELADLFEVAYQIAYQGLIAATFAVVGFTYVTWRRMNKDVRRARMFILADRFDRFLLAFTLAFLVLTAVFLGLADVVVVPLVVSEFATIFFLVAIFYATLELFFVAHPRALKRLRSRRSTSSASEGNADFSRAGGMRDDDK